MASTPKKSSSSGSEKKWSWSLVLVGSIVDCLKKYKSHCELNATDVNADKVINYMKRFGKDGCEICYRKLFWTVEKTVPE